MNEFERLRRNILTAVDIRSYWIDTSGVKSYFNMADTPINNFCPSYPFTSITINQKSVSIDIIKEIHFKGGYNSVVGINNLFIRGFNVLTYVNLEGLISLTSLAQASFFDCPVLTSVDLSPLVSLEVIEGNSFSSTGESSLREIKIGNKNWTNLTISSNTFQGVPNDSSCVVYAATVSLANIFKNKVSSLSDWSVAVG